MIVYAATSHCAAGALAPSLESLHPDERDWIVSKADAQASLEARELARLLMRDFLHRQGFSTSDIEIALLPAVEGNGPPRVVLRQVVPGLRMDVSLSHSRNWRAAILLVSQL